MCQGAQTLAKEFSLFIFAHGDNGMVTISCRGTALDRRSSATATFQQWSTEKRIIYLLVKRKLNLICQCQYMTHVPRSVPLTYGSDLAPDPAFFVSGLQDQLIIFFYIVLIITFWGYIYLSLQQEKSKTSHKLVKIKAFLHCFVCWKDPDLYKFWQILFREVQKHTDTDPPHWLAVTILIILFR